MSDSSRTNPVSRYVRARLRAMQDEGASLKALADRVKLTPSIPSQVTGGMGVGAKSLPKFAEMLGLSLPELFAEAEAWAAENPSPDAKYVGPPQRTAPRVAIPAEAGRARARSIAEQLGVAVPTLDRVDALYVGQDHRSERWWLLQYLSTDQALAP